MRKSSVSGLHAVRGEKSRRYGHRCFETTRKSPNIEYPLWPKREIAQKRSPKDPPLDKNKTLGSKKIFRHRSHAWATNFLKIFGALNARKAYWPKSKSLLELQKSFASRRRCIRDHLRKTANRFGGRAAEASKNRAAAPWGPAQPYQVVPADPTVLQRMLCFSRA